MDKYKINPDKWFHDQRMDLSWSSFFGNSPKVKELAKKQDLEFISDFSYIVAYDSETRKVIADRMHELIDQDDFFDKSKHYQSLVLLFSNWHELKEDSKKKIIKKYQEPLFEEINIIPMNQIPQPEIDGTCGEMEQRLLASRTEYLIGDRLVGKLFGSAACITDKLTVYKNGNILLPYFWYLPDNYFVSEARKINKETSEKIVKMPKFPVIGLQVMRNSPSREHDDGWDPVKHSLSGGFVNLHEKLTDIINKLKKSTE